MREGYDMEGDITWVDEVMERIRTKMAWVSEKNRNKIPYTTDEHGNYDNKADTAQDWPADDGLNWWTNGFWAGIQWLLYQDTGEERYKEIARISEGMLEQCFSDFYGLHHDVGFMFVPAAVADYRLTGNAASRKAGLHAANLLAGRFNPVGRFIRAWNDLEQDTRGWVIIDCMMNLSLLYWASEESGDPRFRHIAMMHADTVMKYFIRADGSANHLIEFDPETGEKVRCYGGQGYAEGSSWSRGQGWALYGFTISYLHTGKREYLDTAGRVARYCMDNIPESGILPLDFRQPAEPAREDSCGACVIAGGLLEFARLVSAEEGEMCRRAAVKILRAIAEQRADFGESCDGIVKGCCAAYHSPVHDMTMSYADYFFLEAMYKLKGIGRLLW